MKKNNPKKKDAFSASNRVPNKIARPKDWVQVWDSKCAGIAFDEEGMHLATIWPDGEIITRRVPWDEVSPSLLSPFDQWILEAVNDAVVDDSWSRLLPALVQQKNEIITAMFDLVQEVNIQISLYKKPFRPTTPHVKATGRARSILAADFTFRKRLARLRRQHRQECLGCIERRSSRD